MASTLVLIALVVLAGGALAWSRNENNKIKNELISIFETTRCGAVVTGENRTILHANHAFENMVGRSREEIEGRLTLDDVMDGACLPGVIENHEMLRDHPNAAKRRYQARLVDKTGNARDVMITEGPIRRTRRCISSFEDISAVKLNEWAARESLQKYVDIFEHTAVGIFQTSADGRYLNANRALAAIYGYDGPRDLMQSLTDISRQLYVEAGRRGTFVEEMQKNGEVFDFESEIFRKDGSKIWIRENARAVRDAGGAFLYYEGNVEDVTRRREFEAELRVQNDRLKLALAELKAAQSKLVEQERLHVIGRMASGIAHDFNNALSPILGYAELLLKQTAILQDPARAIRYLKSILSSARDAATIVGNLRKLYRPRSHSEFFRPLDLAEVARQAIALTQPRWKNQALGQGAEIRVFCQFDDAPAMIGDESELREAFTNLIFNAVDAMPGGGAITISLACQNGWLCLSIEDTGKGMPADVRARCFEPFFTTKGEHGTGLGLAMVHGIVMRHGGQIEVQSEPGRFTRFNIRLPLQNEAAPAIKQEAEVPEHWPREVLCVDDETFVLDLLRDLLEAEGSRVVLTRDGKEALKVFATGRFDLVILDQGMPGMNGEELAERVKAAAPAQPILMLTGFGDFMIAENNKPKTVDCVVGKPVTREALRKGIAQAIRSAKAETENNGGTGGKKANDASAGAREKLRASTPEPGAGSSASPGATPRPKAVLPSNAGTQNRQDADRADKQGSDQAAGRGSAIPNLSNAINAKSIEAIDRTIMEITSGSVIAIHEHLKDKAEQAAQDGEKDDGKDDGQNGQRPA